MANMSDVFGNIAWMLTNLRIPVYAGIRGDATGQSQIIGYMPLLGDMSEKRIVLLEPFKAEGEAYGGYGYYETLTGARQYMWFNNKMWVANADPNDPANSKTAFDFPLPNPRPLLPSVTGSQPAIIPESTAMGVEVFGVQVPLVGVAAGVGAAALAVVASSSGKPTRRRR